MYNRKYTKYFFNYEAENYMFKGIRLSQHGGLGWIRNVACFYNNLLRGVVGSQEAMKKRRLVRQWCVGCRL